MQPNVTRLLRALAREGLLVHRTPSGDAWVVRHKGSPNAPDAEILLPPDLPLEAKAVAQLCDLAGVSHPDGGRACRACATPDFHPGDSGVAIGSVLETEDLLVPQAVGVDINCGMRLHTVDLTVDRFLSRKEKLLERLKGDYLLGTRDIVLSGAAMSGALTEGLPGFLQATRGQAMGALARVDLGVIEDELPRVHLGGALQGDLRWAPHALVGTDDVRDEGLATIGRGNHFAEVQVVEEVFDRSVAYRWGVTKGQVAIMIHSGSRNVGRYVGSQWEELARTRWPATSPYPKSRIFPISTRSQPELAAAYLRAEHTAANYGFLNRALLAELFRLRVSEVYGETAAPLLYDLPHNITLEENGRYVARKGACPAHDGQPVIIPGSMANGSYLCVGLGQDRMISSASHGAGRAIARGAMGRSIRDDAHREALGLSGVHCVTLHEERMVEEAPAAYKPIRPVIDAQIAAAVLRPVARLTPLVTFKA